MKIIYTKHALNKFPLLNSLGWDISKRKIAQTVKNPQWTGVSRFGQKTAMSLLDKTHILRVIFDQEGDIIKVITFHPARRGKYETTL